MANKRKKKKLLLSLTALVLVAALGAGIWFAAGNGGETVYVYPFEYVGMTEYWGDSQESYGPVTTDKIQTVFLSDTQTVTEIMVKEGDTVKKGDILMSFDTSLDSLAVERKGLEVEKLKLKLKNKTQELERVRNMLPYVPVHAVPGITVPDNNHALPPEGVEYAEVGLGTENLPLVCWMDNKWQMDAALLGRILNEAQQRQLEESKKNSSASAFPEFTIPEITLPTFPELTLPTETKPAETEPEETEETQPQESKPESGPHPQPGEDGICYAVIRMTKDNMSRGTVTLWQGLRIERKNGTIRFGFFDAAAVKDIWLELDTSNLPDSYPGSGYTSQQLKQMESDLAKEIKQTNFDIRMAEAEYKLMQIEVSDGNVYAQIDGQILSILPEEEAKLARQPLIKLSGGGGFYVEGSVNELEKDKLKPGQEVTINDWNTGMTYTGEVKSVGDFPLPGDNWTGMGNPNASYYPFQVFIGEEADLQEGSFVSVLYSAAEAQHGVYLQTPFIRTEQGRSYVFLRNEAGRLEKRFVRVGKSLWGSYLEILDGVSAEDLVAFPYGKAVKEGAPAEEGDLNSLYGY